MHIWFKQILLVSLFFAGLNLSQGLDDAFDYSASGIIANKVKLTLVVQNLANQSTQEDLNTGLPWQKRFAVLEPDEKGVRVVSIERSNKPFGKYWDPAVPQANADGFMAYSNVNLPDEMVNLAYTEIMFEANLTTFRTTKAIYQNFIDILK